MLALRRLPLGEIMRFTKSLAAAGALSLAVLTASPAFADGAEDPSAGSATTVPEVQDLGGATERGPEAETGPVRGTEPESTPESPAEPRPEQEPAPEQQPQPEQRTEEKPQAEEKPDAPLSGVTFELSPGAVYAGEKVGYEVTAEEPRATGARVSSPALSSVHTVVLSRGRATGAAAVRDDLRPGAYPVTVEILLGEKVIGTAKRTLTVRDPRPVVKPAARLDLRLEPRKVLPGQSYYAGVTTENVEPGTVVTVKDPGGRHHRVRLDHWGTARVELTVPGDTDPGPYRVVAYLHGGPSDAATLTVAVPPKPVPAGRLHLALDPHTVVAGGEFTAVVSTRYVAPGTPIALTDPAGKTFTVWTGKDGVAAKRFHVPSSTGAGAYWFVAKLPTGQKSAARLTVKAPYRPSGDFTPRGGAQTGGGLAEAGSPASGLGALALGGVLIAGGSGLALYGRRGQEG